MNSEFLIINGCVLTMDSRDSVIENGAVLIRNGVIQAVGRAGAVGGRSAGMRVIDAQGGIVMPGLVNCHTHLPMALFKGMADDLPLDVWLNEHMFPAEATRITSATAFEWGRHAMGELLLSGTTTCCDGYFYEDRVADAALETGIRAVLGQGIIDFPAPGVPDSSVNVEHAADFAEKWMVRSSRIHPSLFCHSPYTCSAETLVKAKRAATLRGLLFQVHVAETRTEQELIPESGSLTPVQYLDSLGIIDRTTLLVHGVWLDSADIAIIKKRGASVVHCPESNMKLASGIAPVQALLEAGVNVTVGTDGSASNNDLDLFGEMASAMALYRIAGSDPCVMDARTLVRMATIGGAAALGLDTEIGSLASGKKADMIVINTSQPHLLPMTDPFSALVSGVRGGDVTEVMVDGELLVENGCLKR